MASEAAVLAAHGYAGGRLTATGRNSSIDRKAFRKWSRSTGLSM
jgi:hypothetical protein